jgi:RNA polymerase sigma-70 factor (ECF subfamily)
MAVDFEAGDEAKRIASILAGDTEQYHALIRPYERSVYMMALSFLKNKEDAEEVAQEAFLKAFRNLSAYRSEAKFSTWLVSITLNEARSRLRSQGRMRTESLDTTPEHDGQISPKLLRDWREVPSEALERKEVRELLQQAIHGLPDIYREVFLLRDVEQLSIAEAAAALTISVANVKVRLHRARILLQKQLAPQLQSVNPKRRWRLW